MVGFFVTAALATGCVPPGGTYGSNTYYTPNASYSPNAGYTPNTTTVAGTGIYVNNQELSADDKAKLEWLIGQPVPAGQYYVTDDGLMGIVGQQPTVNLVVYAKEKGVYQQGNGQKRGSQHFNGYSGDSITSDGNGCTIVSSGSMSYSSGC